MFTMKDGMEIEKCVWAEASKMLKKLTEEKNIALEKNP